MKPQFGLFLPSSQPFWPVAVPQFASLGDEFITSARRYMNVVLKVIIVLL